MSHEVETMAYAYDANSKNEAHQHPWHIAFTKNSSHPVTPDMSPEDMLKKAGIDWTLDRHSQFIEIDGKRIPTGKDVLVRSTDHKIMTHISEDWHEVQNDAFVDFFQEYCAEGSMEMTTMGSLKGGEIVFACARIKDMEFSLARGKDIVQPYFLFSNPHQYGKSLDLRFTATRVVCQNTLSVALRGFDSETAIRVNHRKAFDPDMVKEQLGIARTHMDSYKEAAEFLSKKRFSVENLVNYYKEVFPSSSKKEDKMSRQAKIAYDVIDTQPGATYEQGSWWQAFNSVTYTVDHLAGRSDDTRAVSALYGNGRVAKARALDIALEYAEAV